LGIKTSGILANFGKIGLLFWRSGKISIIMCHVVIRKVDFALELKRLKLSCARAPTNKRAYNKVVKKLKKFEKYQNRFGVVIHHHICHKKISYKLI
jgi:hypothetical protein